MDEQKGRVIQNVLLGGGDDHILQLSQQVNGFVVLVAIGFQQGFLRIRNARQKYHVVVLNGLLYVRAFVVDHVGQPVALAKRGHFGGYVLSQLLGRRDDAAVQRRIDAEIIPVAERYKEIDHEQLQNESPKQQGQVLAPEGKAGVGIRVVGVSVHDLQHHIGDQICKKRGQRYAGKDGPHFFDADLIAAIHHAEEQHGQHKRSYRGAGGTTDVQNGLVGNRKHAKKGHEQRCI